MTAEHRPEISSGFSWRKLPEIKASLPVPENWYSKVDEMPRGVTGYFFAKEPISDTPTAFLTPFGALIDGIPRQTFQNRSVALRSSPCKRTIS